MASRRTRATGLPLPIEVPTELFANPRFNRELRNLQSDFNPPTVIYGAIPEHSTHSNYDIRRQLSPSTSQEASLQHYMHYPRAMVNTPEGAIFHTTAIPMDQGVMVEPNRSAANHQMFLRQPIGIHSPRSRFRSRRPHPHRVGHGTTRSDYPIDRPVQMIALSGIKTTPPSIRPNRRWKTRFDASATVERS